MSALSSSFLVIFAALFPIINPPGTALMFLAMTRRVTRAQRRELAKQVAIYAFVIISASLYIGAFVLSLFGVSLPVLRVAGGWVVAFTGWQLLNASAGDREPVAHMNPESGGLARRAFYPLTMPLTTGPGTIAVTIALGTGRPKEVALLTAFAAGTLLATLAIAVIIYICYAKPIVSRGSWARPARRHSNGSSRSSSCASASRFSGRVSPISGPRCRRDEAAKAIGRSVLWIPFRIEGGIV